MQAGTCPHIHTLCRACFALCAQKQVWTLLLLGVTGGESAGSLGLLQEAPEGSADSVPAGKHSAVATAARVPAHLRQAAAWGRSPLCYALGHLRCAHIKQQADATPLGRGGNVGVGRQGWMGSQCQGQGVLMLLVLGALSRARGVCMVLFPAAWGQG